jgi:hypothetical protein
MQEIIVLSIALIALIYLVLKFIVKPKEHDCGNCGMSNNLETKKQ